METLAPLELGDNGLHRDEVVAVARHGRRVALGEDARAALARGAAAVTALGNADEPVYGVSTGFGALANTVIPSERSAELQVALVRSHAAGMGPPVEAEVVRAMLVLRARSLAMGYSGVRVEVAQAILGLLNHDLTPVVGEHGSVGASGDLAPLATAALALLGEGEVDTPTGRHRADVALAGIGQEPLVLSAKEGLALVNGTDGMLGMLVLALADLDDLYLAADVAAAMSVEALLGTDRAFDADLVAMRPQPGQQVSAANLRALLAGSPIVASHRFDDDRVQDAYSLRCTPQVHGAGRDTIAHAATVADAELRSFIDNPVVLPDGRVASCGNFHGAPVAYAADHLAVPIADLSALSERRTDRLLDPARSHGLPPFLSPDPGVNSGLMIAQYTQAAMVTTNRRLAAPASVDTVSTSAGQEDHVSMGWGAVRKLREAVDNLRRVLAVELLAATHGLALRAPLEPAVATGAVADLVTHAAGGPGPDRHLAPRLAAVENLLHDGSLLAAAADHVDLA
ncbi:histidine ammonia-lyase [Salsipaludibacter albus]|uniref:histidine ammonia-lyase n=1 Tax=Salsipaludibacter albus TaxID=2849650 RepID=UPI001EE3C2F2|nr:histidine ammonia-lyase [Salsipaludibacter albus]MBY5161223.1 histidine ammonia-lyase [Salsipaludibacter albus]